MGKIIVLQRQTAHAECRRFVSKDLMQNQSFPVTVTKSGPWKLSTVEKVCSRVDHTGSAVLRKPGSGRPTTAFSFLWVNKLTQNLCDENASLPLI